MFAANFISDFFTVGDMIVLKIFGYEQFLALRASLDEQTKQLDLTGVDLPRNFSFKQNEQIIMLQKT